MSNTSKGRGTKGSKFWMQIVIENQELQKELNQAIGNNLEWISPLAGENEEFAEYELQHSIVKERLDLSDEDEKREFAFWPKRQPQWDGLAIGCDGKTLYIVEAKAHLSELASKLSARNEDSIKLITNSMKTVHDTYYANGDFDAWINRYYQLGNRLTFLHYLKKIKFKKIENVKLVLLNFVEDITYKFTTEEEWKRHYKEVFKIMTGKDSAPEDVIVVNFKVSNRGIAANPVTGKPVYDEAY